MMTIVQQMAGFVNRASYEELSDEAKRQLKLRVLDTIGCAVGALDGEPIRHVRAQVKELGGTPQCTLIGGGRTSLDRAAFHNAALVRYLDFMDNFLCSGGACHPSDNFGAVLAAGDYGAVRGIRGAEGFHGGAGGGFRDRVGEGDAGRAAADAAEALQRGGAFAIDAGGDRRAAGEGGDRSGGGGGDRDSRVQDGV